MKNACQNIHRIVRLVENLQRVLEEKKKKDSELSEEGIKENQKGGREKNQLNKSDI